MKRPRLFWRVYLHSFALVLLVALAVHLGYRLIPDDSAWRNLHEGVAHHLADELAPLASDPPALRIELLRLRTSMGLDLSWYDAQDALIATNVEPALALHARHANVVAESHGSSLVLADTEHYRDAMSHATILGLVLLAIALGSIPLVAAITRPIERLTVAAKAFGRGELGARSGIERRDEVGQLARAFDEMATRIERLIIGEKELLANVSHELRTPLARIRVALDIAAEGDLERAKATIAEIGVDLDELDAIIGDLLTAARLELGTKAAPLRRARMAFREVIDHSASRFRSMHPDRELSISIEGSAEIDADLGLLRRAVDNVLDNARKYSDRAIIVSARAEDAQVMIDVGDRGIGIDEADLPHIFTPFFRTDRSRARSGGGVGLGLMLARRIVEAHGGQIGIESAPGVGTTVHIRVPRA